jgi:TonB family protein
MAPARARANLGSLISNDDYPAEALRNNEQGIVGFRLEVGVDGMVSGCTIIHSSGFASLDSATCRLLTERARFTPARSRRGKPVTDTVMARIVWRIEESGLPVAATLIVATMRVTSAGEATCALVVNARPPQIDTCPADVAARMSEEARARGMTLEQTIVKTVTPGGEVEPADRGDHGTLFFESEAVLSVASDGSVLECRVARNSALGPATGRFTPPSPCDENPPGRQVFERAAEAGAPRTVNIKIRGYSRP